MTSRRGGSRGWEIRLGALQVVVWLGLSLGAIFGSYFIGFFSGRYVGFEAARTASGVEVPKLALTEEFPEKTQKGWDNVYGKLGGAAKVEVDEKPAHGEKPQASEPKVAKAAPATKEVDAPSAAGKEPAAEVKKDLLSDTEAIFNADVGGTESVVDDSPSKEISGKGGDVRVLGREIEAVDSASRSAEEPVKAKSDESISASQEATPKKVVAVEDEPAQQPVKPKPATEAKLKEPTKEKVSVVKRLPKGYFAQVAAPKTRAEAEEISRKLRKSGFPVVVEDNSTGRSPFYRVMVGPEDNKVQADRMLGQLKREKYLDGKIFVRQVK